jgi:hypothetical protein
MQKEMITEFPGSSVSGPIGAAFIVGMARAGSNLTGVLHLKAGIPSAWLH